MIPLSRRVGWTQREKVFVMTPEPVALPTEADLQLLFARLNYEFFNGEAPDCRIRYNERFSNSAGRITYGAKPLAIELSPKHFRRHPEALQETLLHEMIHAWCYVRFDDTGHGPRFKRKLRECGLSSIYHDLGNVAPLQESRKRYILRCERCAFETLRRSRPRKPASCPRCNKSRFDARYPLAVYEILEMRRAGTTLDTLTAAQSGESDFGLGKNTRRRAKMEVL
jgi:predicted SprT family Zn-dependent metalloprotease